jgi:hypothetical protein
VASVAGVAESVDWGELVVWKSVDEVAGGSDKSVTSVELQPVASGNKRTANVANMTSQSALFILV